MPIYEYACQSCSHRFETLVMNQSEKVECPACHGDKLEKLLSAHAVGSGSPDTPCGMPPCGAGACPACE
ncbi:MAG: zinc ribbon domain-containing protein [Mariprofundaceae bacterium]